MLAFIDESGFPHPTDPVTHPVLAAVCYSQGDSRRINRRILESKQNILGLDRAGLELKAHDLLKAPTFRRKQELKELVEAVFNHIRSLPVTTLAVVMERPRRPVQHSDIIPPYQYRYMLQRIHDMSVDQGDPAVVIIDGEGASHRPLSRTLEHYLNRTVEGQSLTGIADTPYFVDSKITIGIQLADMVAGVVRQYHQNGLNDLPPPTPYLSDVSRYYSIVSEKTRDYRDATGGSTLQGIYRMPEQTHYFAHE